MFSKSIDLPDISMSNKRSTIKPRFFRLNKSHSNSSSTIMPSYQDIANKNNTLNRDYSIILNDEFGELNSYNDNFYNGNDNVSLNGSITTANTYTGSYLSSSKDGAKNSANNPLKDWLIKCKKLKKSDISNPVNFNHVAHLDKPVPIGRRYKLNY
jgi:hypothetical protein